ncbi:hypothetical protein AC578_807 [Pseudocercospora eumusae]|uniref:RING-type domain-containing protein n=1 Tax=Pseudocercospora eumusae TaxID=321146 RepID=A0A139HBZ1_9PEZI|nr:hypothetical protein AC578_807 [Pseudocercospora eumusae]
MMALLTKDEFLAQLEPTSGVAIAPDQDCPVCYEPIVESTLTSCRHVFCFECLKQWLTTSHTCPACRQELYQKPDDDYHDDREDEEDGDDDEIEQIWFWPQFDFEYDEPAARLALHAQFGVDSHDAILACSLQPQAFINYDKLLTTAVAAVVARLWHYHSFIGGATGPDFVQGWTSIASAIESVLSRNRHQTMAGFQLFLAMEQEVQQTIRAPRNQSLFARRHSLPYRIFEEGIGAVLRLVVEAGYKANPVQYPAAQFDIPVRMSTLIRACLVHPHDFGAAYQRTLKLHEDIPTLENHLTDGQQAYVSKSLLLPVILAWFRHLAPSISTSLVLKGRRDLADRHGTACLLVANFCTGVLGMFNGDIMNWKTLLDKFRTAILELLARTGEWPAQDRETPGFEQQLPEIVELMKNDLDSLLMPCIVEAVRLHGKTELPPVTTETNDHASAAIKDSGH